MQKNRVLWIISIQWLLIAILIVALICVAAGIPKLETVTTNVLPIAGVVAPELPQTSNLRSIGAFKLTAYCPCVKCCGVWSAEHPTKRGSDYVQKTYSGTVPTAGRTIAVDKTVIPLGSTVIIEGHEYIAEDIGDAVKGNVVDVFFNEHKDALDFGVQSQEIFIKSEGD
jgi:3D (Asp-Asp-Asp) domain-containing protein